MRNFTALFSLLMIFAFNTKAYAQADKIVGEWKTIDDETKEEKSYVKIFKATDGLYYGRVIKLIGEPQDKKCTKCTGSKKNKPIVGMIVISKMEEDGDILTGGKIMDPKKGKSYSCKIWLDEKNKDLLYVRGSIIWGVVGRSQNWHRVK